VITFVDKRVGGR